jgi:hypothetical protein
VAEQLTGTGVGLKTLGTLIGSIAVVLSSLSDLLMKPSLVPSNIEFLVPAGGLFGIAGVVVALGLQSTPSRGRWLAFLFPFLAAAVTVLYALTNWTTYLPAADKEPRRMVMFGTFQPDAKDWIDRRYPNDESRDRSLAILMDDWTITEAANPAPLVRLLGNEFDIPIGKGLRLRILIYSLAYAVIMFCFAPSLILVNLGSRDSPADAVQSTTEVTRE